MWRDHVVSVNVIQIKKLLIVSTHHFRALHQMTLVTLYSYMITYDNTRMESCAGVWVKYICSKHVSLCMVSQHCIEPWTVFLYFANIYRSKNVPSRNDRISLTSILRVMYRFFCHNLFLRKCIQFHLFHLYKDSYWSGHHHHHHHNTRVVPVDPFRDNWLVILFLFSALE
jgi:hypothetical protein